MILYASKLKDKFKRFFFNWSPNIFTLPGKSIQYAFSLTSRLFFQCRFPKKVSQKKRASAKMTLDSNVSSNTIDLFDRDRFGQVPGLVHIAATHDGDVVGK